MSLAGQPPNGNDSCLSIRLASEQDAVQNSDNQAVKVAFTGNQYTVKPLNQQTPPRQTPRPSEHTKVPAKLLSSGHRDFNPMEQLSGNRTEYRCAAPQRQTGNYASARPTPEHLEYHRTQAPPEDKPVGQRSISDIHKHKSDSAYDQIRNCLLMMGFVNELKDKKNSVGNESIARQDHSLIKKLTDYFKSNKFNAGKVYKVSFIVDSSRTKISLEFDPTVPVTQTTPQPELGDISVNSFFSDEKKIPGSPESVFIEIEEINDETLFEVMIEKIQSLKEAGGDDPELNLFIQFRCQLPSDQGVLAYPGYRLITGTGNPAKAYVSDTLRISAEREESLYLEFKIPLIELIRADLDNIINVLREYPSALKKLYRNNDGTDSINNQKNWEIIHSKTKIIVRNMEQAAPEKNALAGEYIGKGIAQVVCEHGAYLSAVLKFLPVPMKSVVKGTIVINTLNVMQSLIQNVMDSVVARKNNSLTFCFSHVYYLMVVDQEVIEDEEDDLSSDDLNEHDGQSKPDLLPLPVSPKRVHRKSESEQFREMINIPVNTGFPLETESEGSMAGGMLPGENIQCPEDECTYPSVQPVNKKKNVIRIAGMQRKYEKHQMVEYILQDPNESPDIKIEIIKGILGVVDVFEEFNERMEVKGGGQIKCILDANFGNFAFDRDEHRLIYLDVAPATSTLNDQVFPGNQFMVPWASSREKFVYKLSTDSQMTKLFLLIMVTNELRKLEEKSRLYKDLNVWDENLNRRASDLAHVVAMISNQLVETDKFMSWCGSSLLSFLTTAVSANMFDGDARKDFHKKTLKSFERYMNNELCGNSSDLLTKNLSVSDAIRLLRLLTEVAAEFLAGVKKDAKNLTSNGVKKVELISKGVVENKMLDDFEIINLVEGMVGCKVQHFLPESESEDDGFYDVVLKWLQLYGFKKAGLRKTAFGEKCGFSLESVNAFKEYITGSEFGLAGDRNSKDTKKVVSLPFFLEKMVKVLSKKIDLLLIEPFSGDRKKIRVVQYMWGLASDGCPEIVLKEYSGVGALQNLMAEARSETLILVNHQINNLYSMGDVGDFHWSSVCLGEGRTNQPLEFNPELPLIYEQTKTDLYEKAIFEKIVLALKRLYTIRGTKPGFKQGNPNISDEEFLERIIPWVPASCMEWQAGDGEKEHVLIKMNLSSSNMFRFKPLLRGYSDMTGNDPGKQGCSRIYMIMCFPKAGRYVRWMLRIVAWDDQELSYMNFRGPFSLVDLKEDIGRSTQDFASQIDFMFIGGGYGYSSAHFYLHKVPEITVQSGYSDDFFMDIEKAHPKGLADGNDDGKDFSDSNNERDDTDNLTSLELWQRFYKLDV